MVRPPPIVTSKPPPKMKIVVTVLNFTVQYFNNTLANRTNLYKWRLSSSPDCCFCLKLESLLHIVAGCKSYLEDGRYTWRHKSTSHFIASTLQCIKNSTMYADLPGFLLPCIVTGDHSWPDMVISLGLATIYIIELTVGFETDINLNAERK